jgi:hypothetical protein
MEQVAEKQAWSLSTETQVEGYLAGGLWENLTEIPGRHYSSMLMRSGSMEIIR